MRLILRVADTVGAQVRAGRAVGFFESVLQWAFDAGAASLSRGEP